MQGFGGTCGSLAQEVLELGEDLFDRIEVGTVGRQIDQLGAFGFDRFFDAGDLVAGQVIEDDDVALVEGWCQHLPGPGLEGGAVDGAIEDAGRGDPVMPEGGQEGCRFPVSVRHQTFDALSFRAPPMMQRHVRRRPGLINKKKLLCV